MSDKNVGTLAADEPHPSSKMAIDWLRQQDTADFLRLQEAFASCAIEGNRLAEICGETLRRLLVDEPVSDRYLLGLVVFMLLRRKRKCQT